MRKNILRILVVGGVIIVVLSGMLFSRVHIPTTSSVEIEATLAHSVTKQIGNSSYTFKLYPYNSEEYLLRVEKGNDFDTKVIVSDHTYQFLDLEIRVIKPIPSGVVLGVRITQ